MNTEKSANLAEVEISYKTKVKASDRVKVSTASSVYNVLKNVYNDEIVEHHEVFVVLFLNRALQVLGWAKIAQGGINAALVDNRIVFQYALLTNATCIVLSHNHPSGVTLPSEQDKNLTKKLVEIGKLLDIKVMDHIIYTRDGYYSFAEECEI